MEKNNDSENDAVEKFNKNNFSPIKIILPVIIGLSVVGWLFFDEFKTFQWSSIPFNSHTIMALVLAWFFMVGRDFGLTWRFRTITDQDLTWKQSLRVCMLCEFTSAITPSAVGGSSFGVIYMNREGINFGRATTLMMTTLFLDELFFVLSCPIVALLIPTDLLFGTLNKGLTQGIMIAFWSVYGVIALWTIILFIGIMVKPHFIRKMLITLFKLRFLKRWKHHVEEVGDNIVNAAKDIKHKKIVWWAKSFGATIFSWSSRYMVVNALFWGFVVGADQLIVFCRQFVVWLVLMVSPTPGGSGFSEWLFTEYYADMIPFASLALIMAVLWRVISYYIYLVIGSLIVPSWLKGLKKKTTK